MNPMRAFLACSFIFAALFVGAPAEAAEPVDRVRIDLVGCDGDLTPPIDFPAWHESASATVGTAPVHVCAAAFDATDAPVATTFQIEITDGPGSFTSQDGTADLGRSVVANRNTAGYYEAWTVSTVSGTSILRASPAAGPASSVTHRWIPDAARNIVFRHTAIQGSPGGIVPLTGLVTDRFGNPAADGVRGTTRITGGVGHFATGAPGKDHEISDTFQGAFNSYFSSDALGTLSVEASIDPATTDCDRAAGDPAGAPAGTCSDTATIRWVATSFSFFSTPRVSVYGAQQELSGRYTADGEGLEGHHVYIERRFFDGGWERILRLTTDASGFFRHVVGPYATSAEYRALTLSSDPYALVPPHYAVALIRVGVAVNPATATVAAGQGVRISGSVRPSQAGTNVLLQMLTRDGWRTVRVVRLDANSNFATTYTRQGTGSLLFRVAWPTQTVRNEWNISRNVRYTWQ